MGDSSAARDRYYDGVMSDSDNDDDTAYYHHDGAVSSDTAALYRRLQQAAAPVLVPRPATDAEQQQQPAGNNNNNNQLGFVCRQEGCGRWFATHDGLGRHMVGHKNKFLRLQAAAAGGRVERPARIHACDKCGRVFALGVQLGCHKRTHNNGKRETPAARIARLLGVNRATEDPRRSTTSNDRSI